MSKSMKYAIIQLGSRQYKISEGETLLVERQGETVNFNVLAYSEGSDVKIGTPFVEDAVVEISNVEDVKGDKVSVMRFKSKSRYRKTKGHRQPLTLIKIEKIGLRGSKAETVAIPTEKVEKVEKVEKTEKTEKIEKTKKVKEVIKAVKSKKE